MTGPEVVPFRAPKSAGVSVRLKLTSRRTIRGLPIAQGITLVVGGGFHGKSTLLQALVRGPFYKVLGDGRELCVTLPTATFIQAEDSRRIEHVDISPLIRTLPGGRQTTDFSTQDASGSTSQSANMIEAIEAGAKLLLLDEDSCATNAMGRDPVIQHLVADCDEPIIPFVDRIRGLVTQHSVSVVIVMGASSAFFSKADAVYQFREYTLYDVTARARELGPEAGPCSGPGPAPALKPPTHLVTLRHWPHRRPRRRPTGQKRKCFGTLSARGVGWTSLTRLLNEARRQKVRANWKGSARDIEFGQQLIDMSSCLSALTPDQASGIAEILRALALSSDACDHPDSMVGLARHLDTVLYRTHPLPTQRGRGRDRGRMFVPHPLDDFGTGRLNVKSSSPRPIEVLMALNRLRGLAISLRPR